MFFAKKIILKQLNGRAFWAGALGWIKIWVGGGVRL